jgi:hypothetical protein
LAARGFVELKVLGLTAMTQVGAHRLGGIVGEIRREHIGVASRPLATAGLRSDRCDDQRCDSAQQRFSRGPTARHRLMLRRKRR